MWFVVLAGAGLFGFPVVFRVLAAVEVWGEGPRCVGLGFFFSFVFQVSVVGLAAVWDLQSGGIKDAQMLEDVVFWGFQRWA